jgi:predicted DNA-binding protein (MmcQ/YjbR family)
MKGRMTMKYEWLDEYCLDKLGATKHFQEEWQGTRYLIAGKMFGMIGGDKENKPIVTLKLEPSFGEFLRGEYADIVPGYYMNKLHWNSLYREGTVPDDVLKSMVDQSYQLIFDKLPKKVQKEIMGNE